jgi:WD40 repeat protein
MKCVATFLVAGFVALAGWAGADEPRVSYVREISPILRANCVSCHRPGKAKGGLDLATHAALMRGGESGQAVHPGDPEKSDLLELVSGEDPEMPKDGDPLSPRERAKLSLWIAQGAVEDSLTPGSSARPMAPPRYASLPAVAALAWSPDGRLLAVSGWHEVILHDASTEGIVGRLVGESPRITSMVFTSDGRELAVAGGAPSEFGEIQFWEVASRGLRRSIRCTGDTVFGLSQSPDGSRVAVGGVDKLVRVFAVVDGVEVMRCDNHLDWVLGTAFTADGARVVSASRDKALKLIDGMTGRLVDDVNRAREPLLCLAAFSRENLVVVGSDSGSLRLHRMEPRGGRLAEGDDKELSFVRELDRLPGAVQALAFSPDGAWIAAGGDAGEIRVFRAKDGRRMATVSGKTGPVFALAFSPDGTRVAAGGQDGKIRIYDAEKGTQLREFDGVPMAP